jgi:uncharacterized RDD family membrane protein YckC
VTTVRPGAGIQHTAVPAATAASLKRRLVSLVYESLILAAVLLAGALPLVMLTRSWDHAIARATLQAWLIILCGAFYVWQWSRSGQTLPMKTWGLRLVASDGSPVGTADALRRYVAALASLATLGLGFAWALVDRDGQFLHDRLAGTKLVMPIE